MKSFAKLFLICLTTIFICTQSGILADNGDSGEPPSNINEQLFNDDEGIIHPALSIGGLYSDNIYNSRDNRESDFVGIVSPGVWFAIPGYSERLIEITSLSSYAGGLNISRKKTEDFRRYQFYFLYNPTFEFYSENSDEDSLTHKFEGSFQLNLRGGLSIDVADQYIIGKDVKYTVIPSELDKYNKNLFDLLLHYEFSEKLQFRLDYLNFFVKYDEESFEFMDRADNSLSGYCFFRFLPKTSIFGKYTYNIIDYDRTDDLDSIEQYYRLGLNWEMTEKSEGRITAGYGVKDFVEDVREDAENYFLSARLSYKFTEKTSVDIVGVRSYNETSVVQADYILANSVDVNYRQRIREKISFNLKGYYSEEDFEQDENYNRYDHIFKITPSLRYEFKEWLYADLSYSYSQRRSNFYEFNYETNKVMLRITGEW